MMKWCILKAILAAVDGLINGMSEALFKGDWHLNDASEARRRALLPQTPATPWDELMAQPDYQHARALLPSNKI